MDKDRQETRSMVFLASIALHSIMGTCDRLRTACGIVKNKRLRGVGYNGSVTGLPHCDDVGHLMEDNHCIATRHGEANAISNTDRQHLNGGQAIVIATPCINCIKDLAEAGVQEVVYVGSYSNARGKDRLESIAQQKGMALRPIEVDWADLFQNLFDLLARRGGVLYRAGYRLKITKVPTDTDGVR